MVKNFHKRKRNYSSLFEVCEKIKKDRIFCIERDRDCLSLPSAHFASLKVYLFLSMSVSIISTRVYSFSSSTAISVFTFFYQYLSMDFPNFLFGILLEVTNNSIFIYTLILSRILKNPKLISDFKSREPLQW